MDVSGNVEVAVTNSNYRFKITLGGVKTVILDSTGDGAGNTLLSPIGVAVDSSGNAYVTGFTGSCNFPTVNPFQSSIGGGKDAFVAKLDPTGSALDYSSYLGGASGIDNEGIT